MKSKLLEKVLNQKISKALYEYDNLYPNEVKFTDMRRLIKWVSIEDSIFNAIEHWASERGLIPVFHKDQIRNQFIKLIEEIGELSKAFQEHNHSDIKDAIGDCIVVLTVLSCQLGYNLGEIMDDVLSEIEQRTGVVKEGIFVKDK